MSIGHLQTIWEYRKDVPVMFVLRNIDGARRYLLVKSTNGPKMIMERSLACNPFVIGKLFRYIFPFRAAGSFRGFEVILDRGLRLDPSQAADGMGIIRVIVIL
jgi:hypothetical protein